METVGPVISSVHNQWVKYARSLHRRSARSSERAFLVEGPRLVADALAAGAVPRVIFHDPANASASTVQSVADAENRGARVVRVTPVVMRALADTETPQGFIAVFPIPELPITIPSGVEPLYLVVDAIRDPGNLGTLIRSAAAVSAHAVFVAPGTTDPFAPKVVRAGMGAHFRLPLRQLDWTRPEPAMVSCGQRLAAEAGGSVVYDSVDWRRASCLIVGNEASGLSGAARAFATESVSIPLGSDVESLNAAVAGSVLLFEAARQRRRQELRPTAN